MGEIWATDEIFSYTWSNKKKSPIPVIQQSETYRSRPMGREEYSKGHSVISHVWKSKMWTINKFYFQNSTSTSTRTAFLHNFLPILWQVRYSNRIRHSQTNGQTKGISCKKRHSFGTGRLLFVPVTWSSLGLLAKFMITVFPFFLFLLVLCLLHLSVYLICNAVEKEGLHPVSAQHVFWAWIHS